MRRRHYLAVLGAALAGCGGGDGEQSPGAATTDAPTSDRTRRRTAAPAPTTSAETAVMTTRQRTATPTPDLNLPEGYYDGPMVSAHEHLLLAFAPDGDVDWYVEWLARNRIESVVGFCTPDHLPLLESYPGRFVPFDQEPAFRNYFTRVVDEDVDLPSFLDVPDDPPALDEIPALYRESLETHSAWSGIGEIPLYAMRTADGTPPLPDADWLAEIYGLAADHDVTVMVHPPHPRQFDFHPWEGDPLESPIVRALRSAFDDHPGTEFLVHGFRRGQLDAVNPLLDAHDNWYYDVSGVLNGHPAPPPFWTQPYLPEDRRRAARQRVLDHMTDEHLAAHVEDEFATWEHVFTEHPDRILWGIDAGIPWHFHPDYLDVHVRLYRGVLGRLSDDRARAIAFENAARLWPGATAEGRS